MELDISHSGVLIIMKILLQDFFFVNNANLTRFIRLHKNTPGIININYKPTWIYISILIKTDGIYFLFSFL